MDYQKAWDLQRALAEARAQGMIGDTLLLLEHPAVYTLGRTSRESDLLFPVDHLESLGARVVRVDRGGQITFHGPGQLVGYPIVGLNSIGGVRNYVRGLEATVISSLAKYGVKSGQIDGFTGVWVGKAKIAAIGVKIGHGISSHGFAINVEPDLGWFSHIIPCGLPGAETTSLQLLLRNPPPMHEIALVVAEEFGRQNGYTMEQLVSPELLLPAQV